ncbi:hypothetical protein R1sor_004854 [Riccia sorocarpa]|uniref:Voltage-gated hydrogen channel 1 n=1 Tax=Riccia sorocarpa TaxID=122646 RepID=A0ABD3HHU2_9MARC
MGEGDLEQSFLDPEEGREGLDQKGLTESFDEVAELWRQQKKSKLQAWTTRTEELERGRAPWRKQLGDSLDSTPAHVTIVLLLAVDLLATVIDILKTVHNKTNDLDTCVTHVEACTCISHFEKTESLEFLYWVSISILSILALNVLGLLIAFGTSFFRHPGYVLDFFVVGTALALELFLDSDTVGLLIILTLWRIVRVAHGIFEVTDEAWEKEIEKFKELLKESDAKHYQDQQLLQEKNQQIAQLRGQRNSLDYEQDQYSTDRSLGNCFMENKNTYENLDTHQV